MDKTSRRNEVLDEMIACHEIRKVLSTYVHGCDRGDGPRMQSTYAEDGWDDHGSYKGPGREFAGLVMNTYAATGTKCTHLMGQSQIKVNGDSAGAETYFLASMNAKDENGKDTVTLLSARYVDTLVRESGHWRIKNRICVRDWSLTLDIDKDWLKDQNFVEGSLSGQDTSYALFGLIHPGLKVSEGAATVKGW